MLNTIVSTQWLSNNLNNNNNLVILDVSPVSTAGGKTSVYPDLAIPSARLVNIKETFTDKESPYPNAIPTEKHFEEQCQLLGINVDTDIVVYDSFGIYTSPRVWWLFKVMGHDNIKVLDGGLPDWIKQGYDTVSRESLSDTFPQGNFKACFQPEYLITFQDINANERSGEFQIVDARSTGRFNGTSPEPRTSLQSGSIPHSINVPYTELLSDGRYKSKEALETILNTEISSGKQTVYSCGSGLTACIVMLARHIIGDQGLYLYDGSWTEYAERKGLKVEG